MTCRHCECMAPVEFLNDRTGKWYVWGECNRAPGHEGPHRLYDRDGNAYWQPWHDGDKGVTLGLYARPGDPRVAWRSRGG